MAYSGQRKSLPSSRWGHVIDVLEETHWSFEAYCEAPGELVDELQIRIAARREVEHKQAKRAEQQAQQQRHRRR